MKEESFIPVPQGSVSIVKRQPGCGRCKHSVLKPGRTLSGIVLGGSKDGALTCHRNPPAAFPVMNEQGGVSGTVSVWPGVKDTEACGLFEDSGRPDCEVKTAGVEHGA